MYAKSAILAVVAALAATSSAAEEKRQITVAISDLPPQITQIIPTNGLPTQLVIPTEVIGPIESLIPAITSAVSPSLLGEIESVLPTLAPSLYPSYFLSILGSLPSDVQSRLLAVETYLLTNSAASSFIGEITSIAGAVSSDLTSLGYTVSVPTTLDTIPIPTTTSSTTTVAIVVPVGNLTSTGALPTLTSAPSSGSMNKVGLGLMAMAGALAFIVAL